MDSILQCPYKNTHTGVSAIIEYSEFKSDTLESCQPKSATTEYC